ncbi:MAG: hypothetical protein DCC71_24385, partial [Proteobacteria bacterium]
MLARTRGAVTRIVPPWMLVLAGGVAYAVATSSGAPGVAAPVWSLAAIALAWLACALGVGGWVAVALAGAVGALASAALLGPGFPLAHDLSLHVWTMESFARAVAAGDWNPRWHASVGLGTPLGLFYPPLPFWPAVPLRALGLAPAAIAKASLIALHAAAAASMAGAALHAGRGARAAL